MLSVYFLIKLFIFAIPVEALLSGRGIADVTGLISEGLLYGYANPAQDARGIHTRQYSRAFVFSDENRTVALAVVDVCMISQAVHLGVMEVLEKELGPVLNESNVMLLPTHSHSLPGGFHTYWFYQAASKGFINETYMALVTGIAKSIVKAYHDLQQSQFFFKSGELYDASINRSPYAYSNNPDDEKSEYTDDTDKTMHLVKIKRNGADIGMISLFPVHPTSLKNYNHLVSADNKGYAALKMEEMLNPNQLPGTGKIVAAFGQTASGDSSPNLRGSRCLTNDELCMYNTSTCPENPINPKLCEGAGPDGEQFKDAMIVGEKQFKKAKELFESATSQVEGTVDYRFQWVKMSHKKVVRNNKAVLTCLPAMGYSFGAGATDGPGIPPFTQACLEPISAIENITDLAFNKSEEENKCHSPKPILLPTGQVDKPFPWQPEIVPLQMIKLGSLILIGIPAEVTTMSGRRIKKAVKTVLLQNGYPNSTEVIIASMANTYSSYLTTYEEYQVQRYEGASNIFGPHALNAYIDEYQNMTEALAKHQFLNPGSGPPDLRGKQGQALGDLKIDILPDFQKFGDVLVDVEDLYYQGEVVNATFLSGNPRNNLMTDGTFLEVQKSEGNGQWTVKFSDASWETKMFWDSACHEDRKPSLTGNCTIRAQLSNVTIIWEIPSDQTPGSYRLAHYGYANKEKGKIEKYEGYSKMFTISSFCLSRVSPTLYLLIISLVLVLN